VRTLAEIVQRQDRTGAALFRMRNIVAEVLTYLRAKRVCSMPLRPAIEKGQAEPVRSKGER